MERSNLVMGDVVQLNEKTKNPHFIGALAMVDELKSFGAQVGVNCLDKGVAYYRASWEEMDYIGRASLFPDGSPLETASKDEK